MTDSAIPWQDIRREIVAALHEAHLNNRSITEPQYNRASLARLQRFQQVVYDDDARRPVTVTAHLNADHFRGHEVTLEKPPGTIRIIAIGDSHTFGFGLHDDEPFPAQLEQLLNRSRQGRFEVLNLGVPSSNFAEQLDLLQRVGLQYHPDCVLLQYGGDDFLPQRYRAWEVVTLTRLLKEHHLSELESPTVLQSLFGLARDHVIEQLGKEFLLRQMVEQPLLECIRLSYSAKFRLIILGTWLWDRAEHELVKEDATRYGIPYLDIEQDVFYHHSYTLSASEPHFSAKGHTLIAEALQTLMFSSTRPSPVASRMSATR